MRTLHRLPRDVGVLGEPAFAREVDRYRAQLVPIRSRRALAASFGREASMTPGLRAAYAVRWLELGDGVARAGWIELVTESA
jgi:hypothetical protein